MYDHATQSLWSTLQGTPVVGPLVKEDIQLIRRPVVTTTWGEWKARHPETTVLSLDTGHERDYGEGVAYQEYFANDRLMFSVPKNDRRLRNKDEVVGLRSGDEQLAISADYLAQNPVYADSIDGQKLVVLTDSSGANRVYATEDVAFDSWDGNETLTDTNGNDWKLTESELTDSAGRTLQRMPAHRVFWFGWFSQFPETRLVK